MSLSYGRRRRVRGPVRVRPIQPPDVPTEFAGVGTARVTTGLRRRVADAVLPAGAGIRTNPTSRVVRAASNPGPRERGLRKDGCPPGSLSTTEGGNRNQPTDRPEWPWEQWIPTPPGRIAPPHASRTCVRLRHPYPAAPRFRQRRWPGLSRPSASDHGCRDPDGERGLAADIRKFTLSRRGRESFSVVDGCLHVACRGDAKTPDCDNPAAEAVRLADAAHGLMKSLTNRRRARPERGGVAGSFCKVRRPARLPVQRWTASTDGRRHWPGRAVRAVSRSLTTVI